MKGKLGRPNIPLSKVSNRKNDGLIGTPDNKLQNDDSVGMLASGGAAKGRLDKKSRSGINIKPSHKGLLHKDTKTPKGEKIPEEKLEKAENSKDPAVRKRAVFAENAKHWNKK